MFYIGVLISIISKRKNSAIPDCSCFFPARDFVKDGRELILPFDTSQQLVVHLLMLAVRDLVHPISVKKMLN